MAWLSPSLASSGSLVTFGCYVQGLLMCVFPGLWDTHHRGNHLRCDLSPWDLPTLPHATCSSGALKSAPRPGRPLASPPHTCSQPRTTQQQRWPQGLGLIMVGTLSLLWRFVKYSFPRSAFFLWTQVPSHSLPGWGRGGGWGRSQGGGEE